MRVGVRLDLARIGGVVEFGRAAALVGGPAHIFEMQLDMFAARRREIPVIGAGDHAVRVAGAARHFHAAGGEINAEGIGHGGILADASQDHLAGIGAVAAFDRRRQLGDAVGALAQHFVVRADNVLGVNQDQAQIGVLGGALRGGIRHPSCRQHFRQHRVIDMQVELEAIFRGLLQDVSGCGGRRRVLGRRWQRQHGKKCDRDDFAHAFPLLI